jgi:hypothetical protein
VPPPPPPPGAAFGVAHAGAVTPAGPPPGSSPVYSPHGLPLPAGVSLSSPGKRFGGLLLSLLLMIVTLLIGYLVWAVIAWSKSTTPAKQLLGMKVIDAKTMRPATTGKMWLRQFVFAFVFGIINSITFGIFGLVDGFMIFGGDKRQRLLDRMVDTYVVDDPNRAWGPRQQ